MLGFFTAGAFALFLAYVGLNSAKRDLKNTGLAHEDDWEFHIANATRQTRQDISIFGLLAIFCWRCEQHHVGGVPLPQGAS